MRRLESYIRKYGALNGPLLYRTLQRENRRTHVGRRFTVTDSPATGRPERRGQREGFRT
jgi:hypothetical protein